MTAGVSIRRYKRSRDLCEGTAVCTSCDKLRADCTRERARQHVKKTGHTVYYTIEHIWIYQPRDREQQ